MIQSTRDVSVRQSQSQVTHRVASRPYPNFHPITISTNHSRRRHTYNTSLPPLPLQDHTISTPRCIHTSTSTRPHLSTSTTSTQIFPIVMPPFRNHSEFGKGNHGGCFHFGFTCVASRSTRLGSLPPITHQLHIIFFHQQRHQPINVLSMKIDAAHPSSNVHPYRP